jgi:hypothetical protein
MTTTVTQEHLQHTRVTHKLTKLLPAEKKRTIWEISVRWRRRTRRMETRSRCGNTFYLDHSRMITSTVPRPRSPILHCPSLFWNFLSLSNQSIYADLEFLILPLHIIQQVICNQSWAIGRSETGSNLNGSEPL